MKKELVKAETTAIVEVQEVNMGDWGDVSIESKDLVLPRLLIQQAMSEAVKLKTAKEGDIVNTLTGENLGESVELLPFFKTENIVVEKWNGRKFEFDKIVPYDGVAKPFEEEINGVRYKNSHQYLIYCLTKDLGMPHVLSFKGTSNKVGRQLVTLMYVSNKAKKLPPPGLWITFSAKTETSKAGDMYQVSNFAPSNNSSKEEIQECLKWVKVLKESDFTVSEELPVQTTIESVIF